MSSSADRAAYRGGPTEPGVFPASSHDVAGSGCDIAQPNSLRLKLKTRQPWRALCANLQRRTGWCLDVAKQAYGRGRFSMHKSASCKLRQITWVGVRKRVRREANGQGGRTRLACEAAWKWAAGLLASLQSGRNAVMIINPGCVASGCFLVTQDKQ
jgi:hypothetical protein